MISGGDFVVTVDEENVVNVWKCDNEKKYETYLNFELDRSAFTVTCCLHPATYLNKVLFGSKQGKLQLWNIKTHSLIHEFPGWEEPVVLLEQAPAVDVVAVGLQSGHIVLYNVKYGKKLMSFYQDFGQVTSISFRTDGQPIMVTGSTLGHISIWDLEKKRPVTVMRHAHDSPVVGMKFYQRQPVMITSSADNSLKMWIFDNPDGSGKVLRQVQGHDAPPNRILFYGEDGNVLLSGGHDCSLRYSPVVRGLGCFEFSQARITKKAKTLDLESKDMKLPAITCIAAEFARAYDWDNVITCHLGHDTAYAWSSQKKAIGKQKFKLDKAKHKTCPTACDISACGNFTLIGYSNGIVEKYNMQSGMLRGKLGYIDEYGEKQGHKSAIRGIHTDSANFQIISTSADKTIKFWRFKDHILEEQINCDVPIAISKLHRESSLLAVAFDNFSIHIYDIDSKVKVRCFLGHRNTITDLSWSRDGRWIVSSSIDGTIKTWDIPSARLIDCFLLDDPPTSVSFSPNGEYLASTHQNNVGIFLWANKLKYSGIYPTPLPDDYEPCKVSLPTTLIDNSSGEKEVDKNDEINSQDDDTKKQCLNNDYSTPEQLEEELITLSMLPDSRWCNLVNLDLIKARNKPKEAPKKPKSAPFFLPSTTNFSEAVKDIQKEKKGEKISDDNKYITNRVFQSGSLIVKYIEESDESFTELMAFLKELSPAELEVEFRMLAPEMGGRIKDHVALMEAFCVLLDTGKYYELLQAYIGLFLKLHGDLFLTKRKLRNIGQKTLERLEGTWTNCHQLLHQSTCLVKYLKSATV